MADCNVSIPKYTATREQRRVLKPKQRKCLHKKRLPAVIEFSNKEEHLSIRCVECQKNIWIPWNEAIVGRKPVRLKNDKFGRRTLQLSNKVFNVDYAPFYRSKEWLAVRYQVIRTNGRKCQACGASHLPIHVDHIKPRSKFPELELSIDNLQVLCEDCNLGKSNKFSDDWRTK